MNRLARSAKVAVIDSFSGTWAGMHAGVMAHHDSTRIHFSDTGRAYLAQLTLNALPLVLAGTATSPLPGIERPGEVRLDLLVPQPGSVNFVGRRHAKAGGGAEQEERVARGKPHGRGPRGRGRRLASIAVDMPQART